MSQSKKLTRLGPTASLVLVLLASIVVAPSQQQTPPDADSSTARVEVFERFSGTLNVRAPNGSPRAVQAILQNWGIPNGQTITTFPLMGYLVMELTGGDLTISIDGQETKHEAGDFWVVPDRTKFSITTGNDTAALQVLSIR